MNPLLSDYKSRIDIEYVRYQPKPIKPIKPNKNCDGVYIEIGGDSSIKVDKLTEIQSIMLNQGEDIVVVKPINLDKIRYKTICSIKTKISK